jgi:hypothetical protein
MHAWMTLYRSDGTGGTNSVDFQYRCRLEVEVPAGLVCHVSYAISRVPGPPLLHKLHARLSAE